jgi:peroxiredoxin family protein
VLTAGAAAMGRKVNIFLQYWALDAFRAGETTKDHGMAPEATPSAAEMVRQHPSAPWSEILAQAKDIGEVDIQACALSMEAFKLTQDDLDPLVDGVEGVAAFMASATGAVVFI